MQWILMLGNREMGTATYPFRPNVGDIMPVRIKVGVVPNWYKISVVELTDYPDTVKVTLVHRNN